VLPHVSLAALSPAQAPAVHAAQVSAPLSHLLGLTADAVEAVRGGRSLNDVLTRVPAADRPAVQALSFHSLRWLGSATEARNLLAPKPPPPKVDAVLTVALAMLWSGEPPPYPDHTLVDQAVSAMRQRVPAAAGFVNAVLRRFLRERETLVQAVRRTPLGAWYHPPWWVERIRHDWPQQWQSLLEAANVRPPMSLRVNARRGTGAAYVQRLAAEGRPASLLCGPGLGDASSSHCLLLAEPVAVQRLPGFAEGEVSVQDAAAQRAALLLLAAHPGVAALPANARVLDACAAPGGKTAQLLELADLDLLALDSDPQRLARVQETLNRLQLLPPRTPGNRVELKAADARQPRQWWDGRPFDAILLDAPCTASGIVRRHPDIRWLRRPGDIGALASIQAGLLDALWPLLKPGGRLLYVTCSLFHAEGQGQIDAFLQRLPAGTARHDPASPGHLLPNPDNGLLGAPGQPPAPQDGFFYALIHKT